MELRNRLDAFCFVLVFTDGECLRTRHFFGVDLAVAVGDLHRDGSVGGRGCGLEEMTPLGRAESGRVVIIQTGNGHRVDVERVIYPDLGHLERVAVLRNLHLPVFVVVPDVDQDDVVAEALDVIVVLGIAGVG